MTAFFINRILDKLSEKEIVRFETGQLTNLIKEVKFSPSIAIDRETGSGGRLIAQLVARELNMKFYDKEFVDLIAKSAQKRKEVVEAVDERSKNLIEDIIDSLADKEDKFPEMTFFKHLCRTILSLSKKNPAVFLGRGANFVVPPERCLRIRIIAPLKTRIANAIKFEHKTPWHAKEDIRKVHFDRKDFVKRYFRKDTSNANYYDLVINTEYLTIHQAVILVVTAFKKRFPTTHG